MADLPLDETLGQASIRISLITFKEFAKLARQRSWTAQSLADRFRGKIENPAEFFHRVLDGKSPDSLIPYRTVLQFAEASQEPAPANKPTCECGCGREIFDRKRYALPGCKTRTARKKAAESRDMQKRGGQAVDFVDARQRQNSRPASLAQMGLKTVYITENVNHGTGCDR